MKRKTNQQIAALTNRTTFRVRFSEIDSMQIVWHGEYVRYFEDGREAFGKQYGLDYMSIYREGYMVPIVDLTCQFKQSLSFGEEALELAYGQNTFSLDVASINYDYPSNILYSWKIDGYHKEWSRPSQDNRILVRNLPPGSYTLQIRAISNEEKYKKEGDKCKIK